jgi:hypothetical protein
VLLDTQNDYFLLCLDEAVRGEVNLTQTLMDDMARYRRTFLFLREIQKHFSLQESLDVDVDRECSTPLGGSPGVGSEAPQYLPGRRVESFHLIGELTELCRSFESQRPGWVRVYMKVSPSLPMTVQMDKALLVTFLVNSMFQSASNIKTFPQVWPNTSDRVHEILVVVNGDATCEGQEPNTCLNVTVFDTGLQNVLTECGFLAAEKHLVAGEEQAGGSRQEPQGGGEGWWGSSPAGCEGNQHISATVYIQLQEYLYCKAVQIVGGSFKRRSGTKKLSSYTNEVFVSLPMSVDLSAASSRMPELSTMIAANNVMSEEFAHYGQASSYCNMLFVKLSW